VFPAQLVSLQPTCLQAVKAWYAKQDAGDDDEEYAVLGFNKQWNVRRVVWHLKEYEIKRKVLDDTSLQPGMPNFLGEYQRATSAILEAMSVEELADYQTYANKWNKNGPPPHVKQL
jgi:hypothetical protein